MGYCADTLEVDFTIPAANVAAALAEINASDELHGFSTRTYTSLTEAVEDITCFEDCEESDEGFSLGYHTDKYRSDTETVLRILAKFANDNSYVRFCGEDYSLWGFRVKSYTLSQGEMFEETGEFVWHCIGGGLPAMRRKDAPTHRKGEER